MKEELLKSFLSFERYRADRLNKKEDAGFRGWDEHPYKHKIQQRMIKKASIPLKEITAKDCVDIANFANFIYAYLVRTKREESLT